MSINSQLTLKFISGQENYSKRELICTSPTILNIEAALYQWMQIKIKAKPRLNLTFVRDTFVKHSGLLSTAKHLWTGRRIAKAINIHNFVSAVPLDCT